ncbi:hypothetical protein KBX31_00075 [Liquorilactobacillus satsumensis]|uniref:Uncharacterized protein n=1 Tax=Liquorilactobacillus satsumensis DSM 16230 = JCM 12392 TaxID=1423801 RepID=A0A0R1UZB7_9LACO|nr:hypothetical protein [Liquorilactobacillus satsumensis]KRL98733.1 hypothetical protein FD50_GL000541 [Liquorilactobacillus satsumensis DSM 16230 = JCM 12392]MCP9311690.1 hypothetical protein [Liquorilactobacillus satsumensis]MCP9358823.1 hypothetical protein [Liquorilactobacillus satsumensis]
MFGFGKKKKPLKKEATQQITRKEEHELEVHVDDLKNKIKKTEDGKKYLLYEELGNAYIKLNQKDAAIAAFEASLENNEHFGTTYNSLLNLYEIKRKEAAKNGKDVEIQKWVTKTEELLKMSKHIMRSKF